MNGSSARGPQRTSGAMELNYSSSLASLQAEITRLIGREVPNTEIFIALVDEHSKELQLPVWLKAHLDKYPGLWTKILHGELVGITRTDVASSPRPASAMRSSVLLAPAFFEGELRFVIGITTASEGPQLSQEDLDLVQEIARYSAPLVTRMTELERLRRQSAKTSQMAIALETLEATVAKIAEENEKLEATIKMRSHLQSNIAHELRTPMASIRGYTKMVIDGRAGEINTTQRDYLTIVSDNTTRLINLVNWMSHILELAATYLKLSTFDVRDVWAECRERDKALLAEKDLVLEEQFGEEEFQFMGDRDKIALVLSGFVATAAKASKPQGQITVEFSRGREREIAIKFSYPNEGQPAAVDIPEIEDIVGMHGGRLFVTSKAGDRSIFHLTLPAVLSDGKEKLGHEQTVNPSRRRR